MKKLAQYFLIYIILAFAFKVSAVEVILTPSTSAPSKVSTNSTIVTEVIFTRSLSIGSYGKDIMVLNKILNLELINATSTSPTFGPETRDGVKKLQEKYATEILIPTGLSAGTGSVGPSTTKKLNELASKYSIKLNDFVLPTYSVSSTTVKTIFVMTLSIGSVGDEVELLKSLLNSDPSTSLNPKNSTNIFDVSTAIAVKKFQEKYASEILTPIGLKNGTGMVGASTRKKLNALLNKNLNASLVQNIANDNVPLAVTKQTFSANFSSGSNNTPSDGDTTSKVCEGTTLVSTKIGFGTTYTTRTANSIECGQTNSYTPSFDYNFNPTPRVCKKTTYEVSPWGKCYTPDIISLSKTSSMSSELLSVMNGGPVQARQVKALSVGTTTCPYDDTKPASFQSCELPICPDNQDISVQGMIDSQTTCMGSGAGLQAYTFSKGDGQSLPPTFTTQDGKECRYTHDTILHFNPLIQTFGGKNLMSMKIIADISTAQYSCGLLNPVRNIVERVLKLNATLKLGQ